jgi:hypothetical protein
MSLARTFVCVPALIMRDRGANSFDSWRVVAIVHLTGKPSGLGSDPDQRVFISPLVSVYALCIKDSNFEFRECQSLTCSISYRYDASKSPFLVDVHCCNEQRK